MAGIETDVLSDIRFLDGVRALDKVARRKAGLARTLDIRPGEVVLEVGPGTGEDLQQFARATGPTGLGIGVELMPGMAEEAKRRAARASNVVFVVADACDLPFRGGVFDAIYAERVLQHIAGAAAAVAEMHRAAVAGGRTLLFEPDQELRAVDHPDRATEALLRARSSLRFANPTIGRQLFGLLTRAGFEVRSVDGTASGVPMEDAAGQTKLIDDAVAAGDISEAVAADYLAVMETRGAEGTAFSVWIAFEAIAVKPSNR